MHHRKVEGTWPTETSHVARGTDTIPLVVANETGLCLNRRRANAAALAASGLQDWEWEPAGSLGSELTAHEGVWNTPPQTVTAG
jgi:hypothetical protein